MRGEPNSAINKRLLDHWSFQVWMSSRLLLNDSIVPFLASLFIIKKACCAL